jgi:hypothetical protein
MRIFRQPSYGDWKSVVADIARALADMPRVRASGPEQSHQCDVRTDNVLTQAG